MLNSKTIEFLLNSMYAAMLATRSKEQRAVATETLLICADLQYAPEPGPDILHRIAGNAGHHQQSAFDQPETPRPCPAPLRRPVHREHVARSSSAPAPHLRLVSTG